MQHKHTGKNIIGFWNVNLRTHRIYFWLLLDFSWCLCFTLEIIFLFENFILAIVRMVIILFEGDFGTTSAWVRTLRMSWRHSCKCLIISISLCGADEVHLVLRRGVGWKIQTNSKRMWSYLGMHKKIICESEHFYLFVASGLYSFHVADFF